MSDSTVQAGRYATAILEAMVDRWQSVLGQVLTSLEKDSSTLTALNDSAADMTQKSAILDKLLPADASDEVRNLLKLLADNNDMAMLPDVLAALSKSVTGSAGPVKAEIVSAGELSASEQEQLRQRLIQEHGPDLVFSFQVDPSIMGGLRVRVGDHLTDMSVVSRLNALRESLMTASR